MHTEATRERDTNGRGAEVSSSEKATGPTLSSVSREFANFIADIEDLIESANSLTGEDLGRVKATLQARVAAARQSVQKMGAKLNDQTGDTVRGTNTYVHEQPWQAIGITAAVSLLVGYLLGRRQ